MKRFTDIESSLAELTSKRDAEGCNRLGMRLLNMTRQSLEQELSWQKLVCDGRNFVANDAAEQVYCNRNVFMEELNRRNYEDAEENYSKAFVKLAELEREVASGIADSRPARMLLAARAFEMSASFGDPEGMWNLGWRYLLGEGRDQSETSARLWWTEAAAKGHGAASQELSRRGWTHVNWNAPLHSILPPRFDVALSFAGEDRLIAEQIFSLLTVRGRSVFYDAAYAPFLIGRDFCEIAEEVYARRARFVLCVLSHIYLRKSWPLFERDHFRTRLLSTDSKTRETILMYKLDDVAIPGIPVSIVYISAQNTRVPDLVDILCLKLDAQEESTTTN